MANHVFAGKCQSARKPHLVLVKDVATLLKELIRNFVLLACAANSNKSRLKNACDAEKRVKWPTITLSKIFVRNTYSLSLPT